MRVKALQRGDLSPIMIPFAKLERWNEVPVLAILYYEVRIDLEKYVPISGTIFHKKSLGNGE
jgi:hypothetical protein